MSYTYVFIYNTTLLILFWTIQQTVNSGFKTIASFVDFKFNTFLTTIIAVSLFSMAGVPPFIGFFSKLLILIGLINSNFMLLYIFFFILLFLGLYFYLQNIRFLYSTGFGNLAYSYSHNIRFSIFFLYISHIFLFFTIFGFLLLQDIFFFFTWILC